MCWCNISQLTIVMYRNGDNPELVFIVQPKVIRYRYGETRSWCLHIVHLTIVRYRMGRYPPVSRSSALWFFMNRPHMDYCSGIQKLFLKFCFQFADIFSK
jgi:hypothetical protein